MEFAVDDRGPKSLGDGQTPRLKGQAFVVVINIVIFIVVGVQVVAFVEFVIPLRSSVIAPTSDEQGNSVAQDRQRRSRHDEQAEGEQEDKDETCHDRPDGRDDRSSDEPTNEPAPAGHGSRSIAGRRCPACEVPQADDRQEEGPGADDPPTGGLPVLRVTQGSPGTREEGERDDPFECANESYTGLGRPLNEPAFDPEPHPSSEDARYCDECQGGPITALLWLKVAGTVADPPSDRTKPMGEPQPQEPDGPTKSPKEPDKQSAIGLACPSRSLGGPARGGPRRGPRRGRSRCRCPSG